jgi:radical SAM superfamily enzyme YgiQ (UPF0313 family)
MIVHGATRSGQTVTLNLQPGSLTVAFDEQTVLAYDRAGRLWSAFFHGVTFRRGLDGGVLSKGTTRGRRERRRLSRSEASLVVYRSSELTRSLAESATFDTPPETSQELQSVIERAVRFTPQAARIDAAHYHRVYRPIGILPPDHYMALVLQLTEGCSFNTCTFCTFYRDRPFHIKSPDEFRAHIAAVCDFMGESLALRRGVFLADANALVVPQRALTPLLELVEEELRRHAAGTKYASPLQLFAFLDGFSGRKKSAEDYAELASLGLKRIYIGLESGHDPLLAWLRKPGHAADAMQAARAIKAGGVNVCVIVLLGAGGVRFAEGHVRDTIAAINAMSLGESDLIYFSEFVALPGQPYGRIAQAEQIEPLSAEQMQTQRREIVSGLRFAGQPPKLAAYDIREFVY